MLGLAYDGATGQERRHVPEHGPIVLGRAAHCDFVIEAEGVLAEHARVERTGSGLRVVAVHPDGVLVVNDETHTEAVLALGDRLCLGSARLVVVALAPRRLATLGAFADAAAEAVEAAAGPVRAHAARPGRIVLEALDEGVDELPDVAGEIRALWRLLEITRRLGRCESGAAFEAELLDAALRLVGADRAFLLAVDEADGTPEVRRARDLTGELPQVGVPAGAEPLVTRVLSGGCAAAVDDLSRVAEDDEAPRAAACAPCALNGGAAAGVLYVDSRRESGLFGALDRELLQALAQQAVGAGERVRLRCRAEQQAEELARAGERTAQLTKRLADLLERRTIELRETRAELARVDAEEGFRHRYTEIVGRGPAILTVLRQIDRVSPTTVPVLLEGESGTGKELLAQAIHASSDRSGQKFVAENCAALPDTLLENELFGHERGAFTGADAPAAGMFERADGGTLFLDEVGDMSPSLQKRLLRVVQEGEVRRVGGSSVRRVDVRVLTATNCDLKRMVAEGRFREDLYYRLAVVTLRVPPLRERREDIPELVAHFLRRVRREGEPLRVSDEALDAMVRYDWPGNVRELENEVRRAAALCRGDVIEPALLSPDVGAGRRTIPDVLVDPVSSLRGRTLRSLVEEMEIRVLRAVLDEHDGNITRTARTLGLSRLGLRKKMQRYGLEKIAGNV